MPVSRFRDANRAMAYCAMHVVRADSGGKHLEKPHLSQAGHGELKSLLYMAALTAIGGENEFAETYHRLTAAHKPKKVAICAIACKLFRAIFAILKNGSSREQATAAAPAQPRPAGIVTQAEYAIAKGVSRQRVGQLVKAGRIPTAVMHGRRYVVTNEAAWLEAAGQQTLPT
jgi:hypothetical protein